MTKEDNNFVDPLLPQALKICIENGVVSISLLQRKLSIGYPRAAQIVDQMEEKGYTSQVLPKQNGEQDVIQSKTTKKNDNFVDPLLPQALKICIDNGVASTTMIQRKLLIGYPRAARIIDQMEERGYISSTDGTKQRAVYISIEEYYSIFGDIYD